MSQRACFYPPRLKDRALLGFNIGRTFTNLSSLSLALASGATIFRTQPSWSVVEDYADSGMTLPSGYTASLAYLAANGGVPMFVAAYGPPYSAVATLTVASPGASIGAITIPISGSVGSVVTPYAHVYRTDNTQITAKFGYYGSLVDSINTGAQTITLASALTIGLNAGDTLTVNQLKYPSIATDTDAAIANYLAYVTFLANQIATYGSGYICLWNELPWSHDPWPQRALFYDTPPGGLTASNRFKGMLTQALAMSLPNGVQLVNGCSDKSGNSGVVKQGLGPAHGPMTITNDGIHPYRDRPEGFAYDPLRVSGSQYVILDSLDSASNYNAMAYTNDQQGSIGLMATECGVSLNDDNRQAVYLLRRVVSLWGMNAPAVVYSFDELNASFDVAPNETPRQSYTALQTLMAIVGRLPAGTSASAPSPVGFPYEATGETNNDWECMTTTLLGAPGNSLLFAWLRTTSSPPWANIPTPALQTLVMTMPAECQVAECIDLLTGSAVSVSSGSNSTISFEIGENVIAVRFEPA